MASTTEENYLKALYILSIERGVVTISDLSSMLNVSLPTANSMVKNLKKQEFGWEEVHEIAEQVEHIDSSIFFERMDELMGHPRIDPHGSPIPDKDGLIEEESYVQLSNCRAGDKVKLIALAHSASDFLKFLNNRDLHLGIELEVISIESYDSSMVVRYPNHPLETLTHPVCERLRVEQIR